MPTNMFCEVGTKIKVRQYTSATNGKEGTVIKVGTMFSKVIGVDVPVYTVELKGGEVLLLRPTEFSLCE